MAPSRFSSKSSSSMNRFERANAQKQAGLDPVEEAKNVVNSKSSEETQKIVSFQEPEKETVQEQESGGKHNRKLKPSGIDPNGELPLWAQQQKQYQMSAPEPSTADTPADAQVTVVNYSPDEVTIIAEHESEGKIERTVNGESAENYQVPLETVVTVMRSRDQKLLSKQRITDEMTTISITYNPESKVTRSLPYVIVGLAALAIALVILVPLLVKKMR